MPILSYMLSCMAGGHASVYYEADGRRQSSIEGFVNDTNAVYTSEHAAF